MSERKINVLVAEDSQVLRLFLVALLESDSQIRVVGAVADGQAAVDFVGRNKPDVVLMDIHMPRMDGFEATRRIVESHSVPIVICSSTANVKDVMITLQALEAGAVACVEKPAARADGALDTSAAELLETVKLMSAVKVVRRRSGSRAAVAEAAFVPSMPRQHARPQIRLVGIGASTGGPPVLQTILASLPRDFPVPILVVQHIATGFLSGLGEWLTQTTGLRVQIAAYGASPLPGNVYLAPDDFHMGMDGEGRIILTREPPEHYLRPAVSYLFRSLARTYGAGALGMLLTGMGRDGAAELKAMKDRGAITIAQDFPSSAVHGMPGEAISLGGATLVLPPEQIGGALLELVNAPDGGREPT